MAAISDPKGSEKLASRGRLPSGLVSLLLLALLSGLGAFILLRTTSQGIGLRDDSFTYFTGAEGLVAGAGYGRLGAQGVAKPITNFPPGYSTLLAASQLIGLEPQAGARLIGGLSFSALVFVLGASILWATRSLLAAMMASLAALAAPSLVEMLSWAMSEGPYLALALAGLLLLALYLASARRALLLASAGALSLGFLTRYVGISLVVAGACVLWARAPGRQRSRLRQTTIFVGVSIAPVVAFLLRNLLVAGSATNRPAPYWHPPTGPQIADGARTILAWVLPANWLAAAGGWIWLPALLLLLAVAAVPFALTRQAEGEDDLDAGANRVHYLAILHAAHLVAYGLFLALSLTLLDRLTPLNDRILVPLQMSGLLLVVLAGWRFLSLGGQALRFGLMILALAAIGGQAARGLAQIRQLEGEGLGLNSFLWRTSPTMEYIREEVPQVPIYTNNLPALYFHAHRRAIFIPAQYDPASDQPAESYSAALERYQQAVYRDRGRLVIVGPSPRDRLPQDHLETLTEELTLVAEFRDGLVYRDTR